jgi:hypothetical protein
LHETSASKTSIIGLSADKCDAAMQITRVLSKIYFGGGAAVKLYTTKKGGNAVQAGQNRF